MSPADEPRADPRTALHSNVGDPLPAAGHEDEAMTHLTCAVILFTTDRARPHGPPIRHAESSSASAC